MVWFLYDRNLRHARGKLIIIKKIKLGCLEPTSCHWPLSLCEKYLNTELFLVHIFLYSDGIRENMDLKKLCIWALFTQYISPENIRKSLIFWYFKGYRKRSLAWNGIICCPKTYIYCPMKKRRNNQSRILKKTLLNFP